MRIFNETKSDYREHFPDPCPGWNCNPHLLIYRFHDLGSPADISLRWCSNVLNIVALLLAPVLVGLVIAWRRGELGAAITQGALVLF